MPAQTTYLNLDERRRRVLMMRSAQLGVTMAEYVALLLDRDGQKSGLTDFLNAVDAEEAHRASGVESLIQSPKASQTRF